MSFNGFKLFFATPCLQLPIMPQDSLSDHTAKSELENFSFDLNHSLFLLKEYSFL